MNDPSFQKQESQDLTIRVPPGRVSGLRRKHLRIAGVLLVVIISAALIFGLGIGFGGRADRGGRDIEPPRGDLRPIQLNDLPGSYDQLPSPPALPPEKQADASTGSGDALDAIKRQNDELRKSLSQLSNAVRQVDGENKRLQDQLAQYQEDATKEQVRVWSSALFFKHDEPADEKQPLDSGAKGRADAWPTPSALAALTQGNPPNPTDATPSQSPTDQQRKLAFLNQSVEKGTHLDQPYLRPPSDYELQAGTVIPAALVTGINTDLPGDVTAAVTRPVYDSRTGRYLLIPQGAKLYGKYDSEVANGQNRALLVWQRLLMPNGRSIQLDGMKGTDAAGYAGVADRVDYHGDRLAAGVGLSTLIAVAGNLARDNQAGVGQEGFRDVIGDSVAQEAGRIGSKIVDQQLNVQPTITIRPGWPLRVLVNQDMSLEPYEK